MTKSTITREQLEEWVAQFDEDGGCDATDRQLEALIRQSLAAMDSEPAAPVAEVVSIYGDSEVFGEREIRPLVGIQQMPYGTKLYHHAQPVVEIEPVAEVLSNRPGNDTSTIDRALPVGTQLYRHAQQSRVPEEATPDSIEILASARRRDLAVFQWDEDQRNAAADSWNACRAAMLQEIKKSAGTEAIYRSNENVQAVEVQSLTSINPAPDLVSLQKKAESIIGNYPGIPDGYVMVPMRLTAENGAKWALSGEFSETKFVNCPECFGDDECETCDGSGKIEITVPVTWTTIKAIWVKGVEHFAVTAQEND
ncbi:hypothetical protein MYF61_17920 [Klebsiella quasipneumoniae]|uniref:hypothetical protein n=1 Tax=Klebsiella quasipneumoniae TaxID=1463165 RepID=UPI0020341FEB|nr:hypothetical protein [Klebsiella quasipneumoniae]MCM2207576.1 hypothetical protein [Klebsiella quasipneumoniae]